MTKTLRDFNDRELQSELQRRSKERAKRFVKADSPVGVWKITTEGDCEGRSTLNLGIHRGHLGDILIALGDAAMYSLTAEPVDIDEPATPISNGKASFCYMHLVNTDSDKGNAAIELAKFLGSDYVVEPGQYYSSVIVSRRK